MSQDSLGNGEEKKIKNHNDNQQYSTYKIETTSPTITSSKMSQKTSMTRSTINGVGGRSIPLDEHIKLVKQKKEEAEILRLQKFQEQLRKKEQKWQQQQLERVKKWLQLRNRDNDHRLQVEERRRKREEEAKAKFDEILRREKERQQHYQQRITNNSKINVQNKPDSIMTMSTDVISTRRAVSSSRLRSNHHDMTNRQSQNDSPGENLIANSITIHQLNSIDEHQNQHANNEKSLSEMSHSSARKQKRPMATSYTYWLNTGETDHNHNSSNASTNFMKSTYSAKCRSTLSQRSEQCPRVCRGHDETSANPTANNIDSHRRNGNISNRQHFNETIRRLAKPKNAAMTQSIHVGTTTSSANNLPTSRSSHQLRITTSTNNTRKHIHSRPATVPTSTTESRTSPTDESSNRPTTTNSTLSRPKTTKQRSLMTTSHSSSSLSSSTTLNKRRVNCTSPIKQKQTFECQIVSNNSTTINNENETITTKHEENIPVNEDLCLESISINVDNVSDTKREQQIIDEQEYQRKLNQKIREAQQREEERKRQLEIEEYEREQEQIRLAEEQRRVEQERLQRAIEERERENELKRQEEIRLQKQREELERKQAEEAERLFRERQEKARKEEEERNERKRRLDLIMRRTRQVSPTSKQETTNVNKTSTNQTNGHDQTNIIKSTIPHSMSENHFPVSSSTEHFLLNNDSIQSPIIPLDTSKFKSPLIQSLLNKARNTRSIDSLTASQIMTESMNDESTTSKSSTPTDLTENNHQENSRINKSTNSHNDLHNLNIYHERPMETATAFQ